MVIVKDLSVFMNEQSVLKSISCELPAGRITIFLGKSGAGKTTVLKTMVGLVPMSSGLVVIQGTPLAQLSTEQRAQAIGYVFQDFNLFAHMTVLQNCIDPLLVRGMSADEAQNRAIEVLTQLHMQTFSNKYPRELSGGQQQRVAIARALCLQPNVLLLDEPTASLDPANVAILADILKNLAVHGLAIALSSHDMNFVQMIFDRAYLIDAGVIVEVCEGKEDIAQCPLIAQFL
ncbi:MAG: ATP-binding cassette domain-containing protein [Candidatus Babeliales bacterium]